MRLLIRRIAPSCYPVRVEGSEAWQRGQSVGVEDELRCERRSWKDFEREDIELVDAESGGWDSIAEGC